MKNKYNFYFICLLFIAAAAYICLAFNNAVWYDEAYTMAMIKHDFGEICRITAQDVHPPLYYILLKAFTAPFGYSLFAAKMFSVISLILTAVLGYVKISEFEDNKTGFIFSVMLLFLPIASTFSVEVRMYGTAALFVTGCGLYAYGAYKSENILDYIIFMMFGVLAAYTHYFALVSAGIIYIMLFIGCIKKKKLKNFIICAVSTVILYIPWLASFISQLADKVQNEYWIEPITVKTVLNYFNVWFKCGNITGIYLIIIGIIALFAFISIVINKKKFALYSALVFVFTNAVGIAASAAVRPVFIERYAVPAIPLLLAAMAVGISRIKILPVIVSVFFALGFAVNYPSAADIEYNASELGIEETLKSEKYEAIICYVDAHLYGVLSYYAPYTPIYRPKLSQGSPFENIYELNSFNADKCKWAALFLPSGSEVPSEISEKFNADFVKTVSTYGIECDLYNLWN